MKKNKISAALLAVFLAGSFAFAYAASPDREENGIYSVNASMVEYDMETGDGILSGKTTIKHDGRVTVSQKGGTFNTTKKSGRLTGGCVSTKNDEKLVARELIAHDENYFTAIGDAIVTKGDKTLESEQLDYHNDTGYAETLGPTANLSSTDGSWLKAEKITYDNNNGVATAIGGVRLSSPPRGLTAAGDTAVYETKTDGVIELIGNATATQNGNTVSGDRLKLTNADSAKSSASGHVRIVYFPSSEQLAAARQEEQQRNVELQATQMKELQDLPSERIDSFTDNDRS